MEPPPAPRPTDRAASPDATSGPTTTAVARLRDVTRTPRGAAGLVIAVAALLLWPLSGWSWVPWAAGLAVLVLLRLLRLDALLRGRVPHVAGLAVVAGLMLSTSVWAWGLAVGVGVALAGLVALPQWRLLAAGLVLCAVFGAGLGVTAVVDRQEQERRQAEASRQSAGLQGERRPERVLPALLEGIEQGDATGVCGLLDDPARAAFVRIAATPDCPTAVTLFGRTPPPAPVDPDTSALPVGDRWLVDGCRTAWAAPPLGGPSVGRLDVRRSDPPGGTYFIAAFLPC